MISSLPVNPGQPLARLARLSTDSFPAIQLRAPSELQTDFEQYLADHFRLQLPEERLQKLLRQSLDAELFADTKSGAATRQSANSLLRASVKSAYSFAILQEQQSLLSSSSSRTVGSG